MPDDERNRRSGGLSPRVRGNRWSQCHGRRMVRSIPASAGEPFPMSLSPPATKVYPRECGGTHRHRPIQRRRNGLSRECGGTWARRMSISKSEGLSPRVRGNLWPELNKKKTERSIPASAGEPRDAPLVRDLRRVYPRECGGTCHAPLIRDCNWGLSPRVRGNR